MHFTGIIDTESSVRTGLIMHDQASITQLRKNFEQRGFSIDCEVVTQGENIFSNKVHSTDMPSLQGLIVDLKGQNDPVAFAHEICDRCAMDTAVIAIGSNTDVAFYRALRAVGVNDYFVEPAPADELVQCLLHLLHLDGSGKGHSGRVIAIHGAHGGVGAGLLSAGLGLFLSQQHGRKSIVVDTDMLSPSVGSYLGCDKIGNLKVLLQAESKIDKVLVNQAVLAPLPQLALLDGWEELGSTEPVQNTQLNSLLHVLGLEYRYQIWRSSGEKALRAPLLAAADIVVLVMSGSLPCARSGQASLQWLSKNNSNARVITVYNTIAPSQTIPVSYLENVLQTNIDYEIPYHKRMTEDILKNVPLHSINHSLYKDLAKICHDLIGTRPEEHKPLLKRLFK